jgi:fluoride ion exporter CrcB/FEX
MTPGTLDSDLPQTSAVLLNRSGAAAVLAAGIGSFLVGVFAVAVDKMPSLSRLFNIYKLTGPLSGVTTAAILCWLLVWATFELLWRKQNIAIGLVIAIAFVLLGLGILLTFPPVADLL